MDSIEKMFMGQSWIFLNQKIENTVFPLKLLQVQNSFM